MDFTPYLPYIYAILAVLAYSLTSFFKNTPMEKFDKIKFSATVITALVIVYVLLSQGIPINEASVGMQLVAYGFLTVLIENILNAIFRKASPVPAVQAFMVKPQGTTDPAIKFSLQYLGSRITPCDVMFTAISEGITKWSYGDGVFASFDTPGQKTIVHTYKIPGTFQVRAFIGAVMSEPMEVTILGIAPGPEPQPVKQSWLQIRISWIRGLFGKK